MDAILYTSNTGFTKHYAELLGEKTGLAVYPLAHSPLPAGAEILYLGWLMAGAVKGYKKAAKKYRIKALCGVGMAESGTQTDDLRKANALPPELPVFTVQGGFDLSRLRGVYKFMMTMMVKTSGKRLSEKADRTPQEDDMLELLLHGGDRVDEKNLAGLLTWYETQR